MKITGKMLFKVLVISLVVFFTAKGAIAQFPSKPVILFCHSAPGGSTDISSRILSSIASQYLGQPIIVVSKLGGGGVVSNVTLAKKSKPDGYAIGTFGCGGAVIGPQLRPVEFDTKKDFDFIIQYADYFLGFAVKIDAPWNTLDEFLDYARKNPGKVTYASAGPNSAHYFAMQIVSQKANVELTHIPYKGGSPTVAACLGGHVDMAAASETSIQVMAGKMKFLALFKKNKKFPNVPTLEELGYPTLSTSWLGLVGPKGIPAKRLEILQHAFIKATETKAFKKFLPRFYMTPACLVGKDFEAFVLKNYDDLGIAIKNLGLGKK